MRGLPMEVGTSGRVCSPYPRQVTDVIYDQIRITATDAGDFVQQIEIRNGQALPDGWTKWTVFYLPGPPGCFPQKP
jgi:hypothetical protein